MNDEKSIVLGVAFLATIIWSVKAILGEATELMEMFLNSYDRVHGHYRRVRQSRREEK